MPDEAKFDPRAYPAAAKIAHKARWESMRERLCECGCAESWHGPDGCSYPAKQRRGERGRLEDPHQCPCAGFRDSGKLGAY